MTQRDIILRHTGLNTPISHKCPQLVDQSEYVYKNEFLQAINEIIMISMHGRNFRHGAFKITIPRDRETVRALNVLLSSLLLSPVEKDTVRGFPHKLPGHRLPLPE
ncbi:hypothetical protein WAI453_004869 [Rhynchosporium graminicola]